MTGRRTMTLVTSAIGALLLAAGPALAGSTAAPSGSTGHDVSWPQCSGSGTTVGSLGGQFGIVGVNDGKPASANPCLASEYGWAAALPYQPALYINTANPGPASTFYWPTSGSSDPALCQNSTSTTDPGCAYDYGWHTAANALATAQAAVGGGPAISVPWWMDVETANSWNGNGSSNTADLQGAADYLRKQGVPSVGIYSSAGSWNTITGGYTTSNAASYQQGWSSEFKPLYPLSGAPTWVAGAGSSATAASTCQQAAFTGPTPGLVQYSDGSGYDADLVCGTPPPQTQSFTLSLSPTSGAVKPGRSQHATVTVTESGAPQTVSLIAGVSPTGPGVTVSPATLNGSGSSTLSMTTARNTPAGNYNVTVTASGQTGKSSVTYVLTVH